MNSKIPGQLDRTYSAENSKQALIESSAVIVGSFQRDFLDFVWDGVDGLVELAKDGPSRRIMTKTDALASIEPSCHQYFSLLPRWRHGKTKQDVVAEGRLLWVDIDRLDGVEEALSRVGVEPTFLYESGSKGYWALWALEEVVAVDQLVPACKAIAAIVGGDPNSAERSRIGRIPASLHHQSGRTGRVISATWKRHAWKSFSHLPTSRLVGDRKKPVATSHRSAELVFSPVRTSGSLTPSLRRYVQAHQTASLGQGGRFDRSAMEQRVFVLLLNQGYSRGEVLTLCRDVYQLPRFLEDLTSGNTRRIAQSLDSAELWVKTDRRRRAQADCLRHHRRKRKFLQLCTTERRTKELIPLAMSELGIGERHAYNLLKRHRGAGYITSHNLITEWGEQALARNRWFFHFRTQDGKS